MTRSGLLLVVAAAYAQNAAGPKFEVASVKLSPSPQERRGQGLAIPRSAEDAARYQQYTTLTALIRKAYRLVPYQNLTGPDFLSTTFVEVSATLPDGATKDQIPEMLQALLAERFKLAVRRETKEEPVCFLTAGKDGVKLKEAAPDAMNKKWEPKNAGQRRLLVTNVSSGWLVYSTLDGIVIMDANNMTMADLASHLRTELNLPVIDRTGLKGSYEVSLAVPGAWLNKLTASGSDGQASDPTGVDIFKSVEKVGLHLEKGKTPIEQVVVEHVEKTPTEN